LFYFILSCVSCNCLVLFFDSFLNRPLCTCHIIA
jgi:hypothetical protein